MLKAVWNFQTAFFAFYGCCLFYNKVFLLSFRGVICAKLCYVWYTIYRNNQKLPSPNTERRTGGFMASVELNEMELQLVCEVLEAYCSDLRIEIAGTDNKGVREILKEKEISLKSILGRLPKV